MKVFARACAALLATVVTVGSPVAASPAHADHGPPAWVASDGSACAISMDKGTGLPFQQITDFSAERGPNGELVAATCHFVNLPTYVAAEDSGYEIEYVGPVDRPVVHTVGCDTNSDPVEIPGSFIVYPDRTALLLCGTTAISEDFRSSAADMTRVACGTWGVSSGTS